MPLKNLNPFSVYRGLPRPIYTLFFSTVINGMGIFVYPFLTLFLTIKLGYSAKDAGTFLLFSSIIYIPGTLLGGKLCDKIGRRAVLFSAQSLASLMFLICGFLGTSKMILVLVLLNLFFDGFADPARSAIQTDLTNPENRQKSFALTYLGHNLGYACGPIIAGFLFENASNWLFWGNAIMGFLAVVLQVALIPETKPTEEQIEASLEKDTTEKAVRGSLWQALMERKYLLIFALFITLYGFAYGQTLFSLPLTTVEIFGERGTRIFGFLMSLNALSVILLNAPIVSFSRKFGTLTMVSLAGVLYGLGFLGYNLAGGRLPLFFFFTFVWTLGEIFDAVNTWYYIANHTPISHRGRFGGIFPLVTGTGRAVAPWAGGHIIQRAGLIVLWYIISLVAFVSAAGVKVLSRFGKDEAPPAASVTAEAPAPSEKRPPEEPGGTA